MRMLLDPTRLYLISLTGYLKQSMSTARNQTRGLATSRKSLKTIRPVPRKMHANFVALTVHKHLDDLRLFAV
jgi:hypothetical protein